MHTLRIWYNIGVYIYIERERDIDIYIHIGYVLPPNAHQTWGLDTIRFSWNGTAQVQHDATRQDTIQRNTRHDTSRHDTTRHDATRPPPLPPAGTSRFRACQPLREHASPVCIMYILCIDDVCMYIYIYICIHTYICIRMNILMIVSMCMLCIYIYIYIYVHTRWLRAVPKPHGHAAFFQQSPRRRPDGG